MADIRGKLGDDGLIQHFLDHGDVTETAIAEVSAANVGTHVADLANGFIDPAFKSFLSLADCRRFNAVPFYDDGSYLSIALADVLDFESQDAIPHIVNRECQFYAAPLKGIQTAWEQIFGDEVGQADASELQVEGDIGSDNSDAPVIKLVSGFWSTPSRCERVIFILSLLKPRYGFEIAWMVSSSRSLVIPRSFCRQSLHVSR